MKRKIVAWAAGSILGALVGFPSDASAWWVRQHSSDCVRVLGDFVLTGSGAGLNNSQTGYVCPVPDTSSTPKTDLAVANVELWADSTNAWSAKPCFADWNGQTGGCDTATASGSGSGHKTISLGSGNTFWDSSSDLGFIEITTATTGGTNRIAGVYYQN